MDSESIDPEMGMSTCVFCEIVAGRREASIIHLEDSVLAFLEIQPVNLGHLLVIPKGHYGSLRDLPKGLGSRMFAVAHGLAEALYRTTLPCDGINLSLSDGAAAGQDIFHCHLRLRPRVHGDSWRVMDQPMSQTRPQLDHLARQIAAAYRSLPSGAPREAPAPLMRPGASLGSSAATFAIRQATIEDIPVLARMNRQLIEDEDSRNPMSVAQLGERMAGWLQAEWIIDLIELDSQTIGYAVFQIRKDAYDPEANEVYLRQFYIERGWRRRGLGTLAVQKLIRDYFPDHCTVVLEVLAGNPAGRQFWSRLGFQPYATTMRLSPPPPQ